MTKDSVVHSKKAVAPASETQSVFSHTRAIQALKFKKIKGVNIDKRLKMDGLTLLKLLDDNTISLVFFDPQYRTILDKQLYGNEQTGRGKYRAALPQMSEETIKQFLVEIERILIPSGHLMVWVDKFILCSNLQTFLADQKLQIVDLITWNKGRMGMGYRTRRYSEYLVILQKPPIRAKGVWQIHNIPDVWTEKIAGKNHIHAKPVELQKRLIQAVTNPGDVVVDPCAGGFSGMTSAQETGRHFLGCDING